MDLENINKLFIDSKIYYQEGLYKKSLDILLSLYNQNIYSLEIFQLIINIYLLFDNQREALKYLTLLIKIVPSLELYQFKFNLLIQINDIELLKDFLETVPDSPEFANLKTEIKKYSETSYLNKLDDYSKLINESKTKILEDPKKEFRYFCYNFTDLIRKIKLPEIKTENINEAVLIEYRKLPHLEFLIRNTIFKLGSKWSHTVICGNLNYDWMVQLCSTISNNIKVIKTNYDNLYPHDYSKLLASAEFWNLFNGEKILIYQEDTCIFGNNIDEFLKWDYIGAPWPPHHNVNSKNVGNGGFSLRTKKYMLQVINTVSIEQAEYNQIYENTPPEDVYFSKTMIEKTDGKVADFESGFNFSSECYFNPNSFGSHCFFLYEKNWKEVMFKRVINEYLSLFNTNN